MQLKCPSKCILAVPSGQMLEKNIPKEIIVILIFYDKFYDRTVTTVPS